MAVKCKFTVQGYETTLGRSKDGAKEELRTVRLAPVTSGSPENEEYYRWTPSGRIELGVLNKKAWEQFEIGEDYIVTFEKVSKG